MSVSAYGYGWVFVRFKLYQYQHNYYYGCGWGWVRFSYGLNCALYRVVVVDWYLVRFKLCQYQLMVVDGDGLGSIWLELCLYISGCGWVVVSIVLVSAYGCGWEFSFDFNCASIGFRWSWM